MCYDNNDVNLVLTRKTVLMHGFLHVTFVFFAINTCVNLLMSLCFRNFVLIINRIVP